VNRQIFPLIHFSLFFLLSNESQNGLAPKRSQSTQSAGTSTSNSNAPSEPNASKKQKTTGNFGSSSFLGTGGSLAIALQASRRPKARTNFMRGSSTGTQDPAASLQKREKSIAFNHVVFHSTDSQLSKSNMSNSNSAWGRTGASAPAAATSKSRRNPLASKSRSSSLWSKAVDTGFQKRR